MNVLFLSFIIYQLLYLEYAKPDDGCWMPPSSSFSSFSIGPSSPTPPSVLDTTVVGPGSSPTPPPVPGTTVVGHSSSPYSPNPAPGHAPIPPPSPTDTFATTTDPTLSIFYDAMEENSQQFFNTTFVNQYGCLCSRLNITLIPCQKATDKSGDLTCSTPADTACKLNKIHSCAIAQITDKTRLISYLACTMTSTLTLPDFLECATLYNVNDAELQQCANSDLGKNLCKGYAAKVMPDMNTIPGFIFKKPEDIKTTDLFEHIDYYRSYICNNDLRSAVCAQLKAAKVPSPPPECDKRLVVGIFYKAMNEKSQKWFHELGSIYDKFSDYLNFKFQPCMFAELSSLGELDCQDPNDINCLVGKTHSCAVWLVEDPKTLYQFLNCTMQDSKTMPDIEKCATTYKIPYDPIKTCASSSRGEGLCYDSSKSRPNSPDIPMFSFELTYDDDTSKKTADATNLQSIFCEQLKKYSIVLPNECKSLACYSR